MKGCGRRTEHPWGQRELFYKHGYSVTEKSQLGLGSGPQIRQDQEVILNPPLQFSPLLRCCFLCYLQGKPTCKQSDVLSNGLLRSRHLGWVNGSEV